MMCLYPINNALTRDKDDTESTMCSCLCSLSLSPLFNILQWILTVSMQTNFVLTYLCQCKKTPNQFILILQSIAPKRAMDWVVWN